MFRNHHIAHGSIVTFLLTIVENLQCRLSGRYFIIYLHKYTCRPIIAHTKLFSPFFYTINPFNVNLRQSSLLCNNVLLLLCYHIMVNKDLQNCPLSKQVKYLTIQLRY